MPAHLHSGESHGNRGREQTSANEVWSDWDVTVGSFSNSQQYIFFGCILSWYTSVPSNTTKLLNQQKACRVFLEHKELLRVMNCVCCKSRRGWRLIVSPLRESPCDYLETDRRPLRSAACCWATRFHCSPSSGNAEVIPQRPQVGRHRFRVCLFLLLSLKYCKRIVGPRFTASSSTTRRSRCISGQCWNFTCASPFPLYGVPPKMFTGNFLKSKKYRNQFDLDVP